MKKRKTTHPRGAPWVAHLPARDQGDRELTTRRSGATDLIGMGAERASAPHDYTGCSTNQIHHGGAHEKNAVSISELADKIDRIERQQAELIEALKLLLPMAITIPSTAPSSAAALKELTGRLAVSETQNARSDTFWLLASAMSLLLSSQAAMQHPGDQEVQDIHRGLRQHKMQ